MKGIISYFQRAFRIDYGTLDEENRKLVLNRYVQECMNRVNVITAVAFLGETILMILDFSAGFFSKNNLNYLNLAAEIIIILASFTVNALFELMVKRGRWDRDVQMKLLDAYKLLLMLSVCLFAFTDIYVRHRTVGAYLVFLFIIQVTPYYKALANICLYGVLAVFASVTYLVAIPNAHGGSLFSLLSIIFAFGFSTECFRGFSVKKIVHSRMNELLTEKFQRLASQTILALSNAVEVKDHYTRGHSQRVAKYSREIARRLGYSEEQLGEIYYIGLLHDIGKIGVDDAVINKNGRLNDEEFAQIKRHPDMGYDILKIITEIPDISVGAKWHHEKYNGTGYPDRLSGEYIPKIAQIIAVADAYDAMTSTRSYRDVMSQSKVRGEIERNAGTQFEPGIAAIMLQMIDEDTEYTMQACAAADPVEN